MKVKEKLMLDYEGLSKYGPINIVILGDSISHGAITDYYDYENVYWNRLKKKLHAYRDYMPINMINAAIAGICAKDALPRLEKQVFCHEPDLVIVAFGLNDVNNPLDEYVEALREIFAKCKERNIDVIFMTENMMNTYVADDTDEGLKEYARKTAEMQNGGKLDLYFDSAIELANSMEIAVCDCYAEWKKLAETQDTTILLANRINHPLSEMHYVFSDKLYDVIMSE